VFLNDPSVSQIYGNVCRLLGWEPRTLIEEALRRLDDGVNPLIVKLPTGYGKTSITLCAGLACKENGANWLRVIHVLPMRSIVDDIELRLSNHIRKLNFAGIKVYKQYMGSPMSPFYCGRGIIVTTLDTFMMNLFKIPAPEFRKVIELGYSHYDIPRANIYSSAIVLDEFHLLSNIGSLDDELKSLASSLVAVRALCEAGVPLVISTATLPEVLIRTIKDVLKRVGIEVDEQNILKWGDLKDDVFEESMRLKRLSLRIIDENEVINLLKMNPKKRILLVMNKVERAVKIFREIRQAIGSSLQTILLHGRLREDVKREQIRNIDYAQLVIATQVVEAGVDKNFDVLITDPCPLDRFIQRAGRVARSAESREGDIYVIELADDEQYSGVYSEELTKDSVRVLGRLNETTFEKLEFEEMLIREMERVYEQYVNPDSIIRHTRIKILSQLDEQPLLGKGEAREAFIELEGFTDSFGIVTVFDASEISRNFSYEFCVGVSEDAAKRLLKSGCMVLIREGSGREDFSRYIEDVRADLEGFKLVRLKDELIRRMLNNREPLTLSLLKYGIEGLAVERIDPVEGLVWI
jgi:CRISPR-associated endonuclease/helicase Cas3